MRGIWCVIAVGISSLVGSFALAAPAEAGVETVRNGGFEETGCGGNTCWHEEWEQRGDMAFACTLTNGCAPGPKTGSAWAVVGAGEAGPGGEERGDFAQTFDALDGPGVISFDLKAGAAVPGVSSSFYLNIGGGSGGSCCVFEIPAPASATGYERIEIEIESQATSNGLAFGTFCQNFNASTVTCPRFDVDNVSIEVDSAIELTKTPKRKTTSKRATFAFKSDNAEAEFECSIDGKGYEPCLSPRIYTVGKGKHIFRIQEVDRQTPIQTFKWKVAKRK